MATPYVKQSWIDNNGANPLSAARMGVIETGIFDAHYKPCVSVSQGSQAIANNTTTVIVYPTEAYDTDAIHSTVSNTSRLTAPVTGKYHIDGYVTFPASATGGRALNLNLGGVTQVSDVEAFPSATLTCWLWISWDLLMTAAQFVELSCFQLSGGSQNVSSGFAMNLFAY